MEKTFWKVVIHRLDLNDTYGPDSGSYTKEELYFETMKDVLRHLDKCGNEPIIQVEMNECKMFGSDNYDISTLSCD